MNGNNTQTAEAFINALSHPRKVELATAMLAVETPEEAGAAGIEAGFDRITVLEMGRDIRKSVEGKEEFEVKIDIDNVDPEAELAATQEAAKESAPETDNANATPDQSSVVDPSAAVQNAAPVDAAPVDAAPVDAAPVDAAPVDAAPVKQAPAGQVAPAPEAPVAPAAPVAPRPTA